MVQSAGESLDLRSLEVVSLNQALLLGGPSLDRHGGVVAYRQRDTWL